MKYPKQKDQADFMGKECFFKAEYYRDYGKERHEGNQEFGTHRIVPVKWRKQWNLSEQKGWIVGFGFCFNGDLVTEKGLGENRKYFSNSSQIKYIRVRVTPTSKELKIPAKNLRFKSFKK